MEHHRNTVSVPIRLLDHPELEQCLNTKDHRVLVFCADSASGPLDITFPQSSELKVNGGDIKANLRGLKKKPGSTLPVDITDQLRLRTNYVNNVDFTYALTKKVRIPQSLHLGCSHSQVKRMACWTLCAALMTDEEVLSRSSTLRFTCARSPRRRSSFPEYGMGSGN
jgi:hypothetical protein